jgi:hypothetical protein
MYRVPTSRIGTPNGVKLKKLNPSAPVRTTS